jgi:conjugative relaxase-like TrwC/TraI family protein
MLIVRGVGPGVVPYFLDGRAEGRWSTAARRGLGVEDPVQAADLRRVLQGRHPEDGRFLPDRRPARRRGGWDLVFGAPKSVSLLAASAARDQRSTVPRSTVIDAHEAAVDSVLGHVEDRLRAGRRDGAGRALKPEGIIAASFRHLENSASGPHLHTHVLVANLGRAAGAWGAVKSSEWFVERPALAALYHLELRHQLRARGWPLDWRLRPDGLADLADVPRSLVRAHSTYERAPAGIPPPAPAPAPALHLTRGRADGAPSGPAPSDRLTSTVAIRLTARRSDFRASDVVVALASCHDGGATVKEATAWVEEFCAGCPPAPSPTAGPRWTTPAARRTDEELVERLSARRSSSCRSSSPDAPDGVAETVRALTSGADGVFILAGRPGRCDLLAQAEVLAECRAAWEADGRRVAVSSPTPVAAQRWGVLTGLDAFRAGDRPDVLVVDQADRRTTTELSRLLSLPPDRIVLVEGGTMPRLTNPASRGFAEAGDRFGRITCPEPPAWRLTAPGAPAHDVADGFGRAAAASLLARWVDGGGQTLLVGLGLEEVNELNRAVLGAARPSGPDRFRPGDPVVVLKGAAGLPAYGTFGRVAPAGSSREVEIAWADGRATRTADPRTLGRIGFGYAVTPHLAGRDPRPVMVLGPASALGPARSRVVAEVGRDLERGGRHHAVTRSLGG